MEGQRERATCKVMKGSRSDLKLTSVPATRGAKIQDGHAPKTTMRFSLQQSSQWWLYDIPGLICRFVRAPRRRSKRGWDAQKNVGPPRKSRHLYC